MTEPAVDLTTELGTEVETSSVDGCSVVGADEQVVSSIVLEDGSSYLLVDPSELIIGPNVRTEANLAKGFTSFAQDIGQRGVKAPIRAYRNADGALVVIEGQMRVLAALDKGRKRVRVVVEPEPAGDETERAIERII